MNEVCTLVQTANNNMIHWESAMFDWVMESTGLIPVMPTEPTTLVMLINTTAIAPIAVDHPLTTPIAHTDLVIDPTVSEAQNRQVKWYSDFKSDGVCPKLQKGLSFDV